MPLKTGTKKQTQVNRILIRVCFFVVKMNVKPEYYVGLTKNNKTLSEKKATTPDL